MENLQQYGPSNGRWNLHDFRQVWGTAQPDGFWPALIEISAYLFGMGVAKQYVHLLGSCPVQLESHPRRPITGNRYVHQTSSFNPV